MGSLFSQNGGTEDNTLITADFATEKDEGKYGGSDVKGLNNNILNILNSEVVRNDFSDTNINTRIIKPFNTQVDSSSFLILFFNSPILRSFIYSKSSTSSSSFSFFCTWAFTNIFFHFITIFFKIFLRHDSF